jgi:hypothetical protein
VVYDWLCLNGTKQKQLVITPLLDSMLIVEEGLNYAVFYNLFVQAVRLSNRCVKDG